MATWLSAALAGLALAWVALLVVAPLLPVAAASVLYAAGSLLCHQIAERSFHLHGFQLPVCGRCLGLYAGTAMGASAGAGALFARAVSPLPRRTIGLTTIVAALPTAATVVLEFGAGWNVSNLTRAAAAVPLAAVVAFVVLITATKNTQDVLASKATKTG